MSARQVSEEFHTGISEKIDRDAKVIRDVKIVGKVSKWGYVYSDGALQKAVKEGLYDDVPVRIDHPDRDNPKKTRSVLEAIGWIKNPQWKSDGIWGDFHYVASHPHAEFVLESAERNSKGFGLSHVADVKQEKHRDGTIVSEITRVRSVDLVGTPATTVGLFEGYEEQTERKVMKSTLKQLVESYGSTDEKKHLTMLESAVLDVELEIDEPASDAEGVVQDAFALQVDSVMKSDSSIEEKQSQIQELLEAQKVLANGKPEPEVEPEFESETPTLESISEELEAMKRRDGVRTLLEEYRVPFSETKVKALSALESKDEQVELLEGWREGLKPERSGSIQKKHGEDSYEAHRETMTAKYGK